LIGVAAVPCRLGTSVIALRQDHDSVSAASATDPAADTISLLVPTAYLPAFANWLSE
jgi:hypothetical protein